MDSEDRTKGCRTRNAAIPQKQSKAIWPLLAIWGVGISVPMTFMAAGHWTPLPVAKEAIQLETHIAAGDWSILHILSNDCACSRSVIKELLKRSPDPSFREEIYLLDIDPNSETSRSLSKSGFIVHHLPTQEFCQSTGSEGVPFFQVIDPQGKSQYSGAYFDDKGRRTSDLLDLETAQLAREGRAPSSRPVFGCPISERLKTAFNPILKILP